jgi:cytochrome c peroxidase
MASGKTAGARSEMRDRGAQSRRIGPNTMPVRFAAAAAVLLLALFCGCKAPVSSRPVGPSAAIDPPLGLPPVPLPPGNPPTRESIALGRRLFYDPSLSKDNSISCASCHNPIFRFSDARARSVGVGGALGLRHAPTLVNVAYSPLLFWDGRAASLESQVLSPMADPLEMNQTHEASIVKLKRNPADAAMFRAAFGTDDITLDRVENALASFERTILCGGSPFDRYQYQGQKNALTPAQVRGLAVFTDPHRGNCSSCHTIGPKYALFTDGQFHNTGEGADDNDEFADPGRYKVTHVDADKGAFKTPTLRDVALSGPYMHDGKLKTLKDVVDFYAGKGNSNPNLDVRMKAIDLTGQDRVDLVEFLKSLTGSLSPNLGPPAKESAR